MDIILHHAILANKAFNLSGDPDAFPEQLDHVKVWQASKAFMEHIY